MSYVVTARSSEPSRLKSAAANAWALEPAPNRPLGNGEDAVAFTVTEDGILLGSVTDEVAVSHPLRLHELKLPPEMRADQEEDAAALGAVIFEHALRQG